MGDIANELRHYRDQLQGKVVLCNCDDPFESNFFKYFASNFNTLGIKKLITTGYTKSPITGSQLSLLDIEGLKPEGREPYVVEINEVPDLNDDGAISLDDVEHLLKHDKNVVTKLRGDGTYPAGDFRSAQCVELLKRADLVVTNPPFSLFREFVAQLVEYDKQFLIIGSKNAITYKEIFRLIKDNKLWLGYGFAGGNAFFKIPPEKSREFAAGVYDPATGLVKFRNVGWFTNLYVDKSEDPITPYLTYEQGLARGLYPKYDNYDAIEVSKIADIPSDYEGVMGVPITFLDRWVPDVAAAPIERERELASPRKSRLIRTRRILNGVSDLHQRQEGLQANTHQTDTESLDLIDMQKETQCQTSECISTEERSTHGSSSSEFEVLGIANSARWIGYELYTIIDGRKIYNRIIIKRKATS